MLVEAADVEGLESQEGDLCGAGMCTIQAHHQDQQVPPCSCFC